MCADGSWRLRALGGSGKRENRPRQGGSGLLFESGDDLRQGPRPNRAAPASRTFTPPAETDRSQRRRTMGENLVGRGARPPCGEFPGRKRPGRGKKHGFCPGDAQRPRAIHDDPPGQRPQDPPCRDPRVHLPYAPGNRLADYLRILSGSGLRPSAGLGSGLGQQSLPDERRGGHRIPAPPGVGSGRKAGNHRSSQDGARFQVRSLASAQAGKRPGLSPGDAEGDRGGKNLRPGICKKMDGGV